MDRSLENANLVKSPITKDFLFQKFEVSGREFVRYQHAFLKKVDQYHENCTQAKEGQDTKNDQKV